MKKQKGFFNIEEKDNGDIISNGFTVGKIGGNKLKIIEKSYNISDDLQNVFTNTSNKPLKKLNDKDREKNKTTLENLEFKNYKAIHGETKSARYKYSKTNFKYRVNKSYLEGQGVKITIPSNIIDIYIRLEILLGLKLWGHTDTLAAASNLIDQIYRIGEIQNEQQYRNALDKLSSH